MIRIIEGVAYRGQPGQNFRVHAHELGNGHIEVSAVKQTEWKELEWSKTIIQDHLDMVERQKEEDTEENAARRLQIAANRAKTKVRRLCKAMGADTLLTLTYRFNEQSLPQVKKDLKEFNRRMLRELPDFRFIGAFEKQKRGAYHVHMATAGIPKAFTRSVVDKQTGRVHKYRVKSFDVLRAVWRSVTKGREGNIDVARRKFHQDSSPAKIASYLSKYISKEFAEGEKHSNRYTSYGDFNLPPSVDLGLVANALEAVEVCYSVLGDRIVFGQHYSRWGDWFYLHGERPKDAVLQ